MGNDLSLPRYRGGLLAPTPDPNDVPSEIGGVPPPQSPLPPPLAPGNPYPTARHGVAHTRQTDPIPNVSPRTRANALIATLNIKGRTSPHCGPGPISKWTAINWVLQEKKISILCVQETHLDENYAHQIDSLFGRKIHLAYSKPADNLTAQAGVALIINKELLTPTEVLNTELIPGRALITTIKWHNDQRLTIINIYAPNSPHAHAPFWTQIQQRLPDHPFPPDLLLGDFNITEDPIDRAPAHADHDIAIQCLRDLRLKHNLHDVWRQENPSTRLFTYASTNGALSRLDRIYARTPIAKSLYSWDHCHTSIPSDHVMTLVRFAPSKLPFVGKGRWTWPLGILSNKNLLMEITDLGINLQQALECPATHPAHTPQLLWESFKSDITTLAKQTTRTHLPKMQHRINALHNDIHLSKQDPQLDNNPDAHSHTAVLIAELQHLERKHYKNSYARAQAQWFDKGETVSKYWSATVSPRRPRDIIYSLLDPTTNSLTTKSSKMAAIARNHHSSLQNLDLPASNNPAHIAAQAAILQNIPNAQKLHDPESLLHSPITPDQLSRALHISKNGTATGPDGIPYEVWKLLHNTHRTLQKTNKPSFNVVKCLITVYNDIQLHGTAPNLNFSAGWMCPIYKKKD